MTAREVDPAKDPRAFRDALGSFATGVTVVTTRTPDGPVGITANSFASVSLDPPLVLWSPAKAANRFPLFAGAEHYGIHVLAAEQLELARTFTRHAHAFDALDWRESPEGIPQIAGVLARFDCRLEAAHDAGDHVILVGRVIRASHRAGPPLLFQAGRFGALDAAPREAG